MNSSLIVVPASSGSAFTEAAETMLIRTMEIRFSDSNLILPLLLPPVFDSRAVSGAAKDMRDDPELSPRAVKDPLAGVVWSGM